MLVSDLLPQSDLCCSERLIRMSFKVEKWHSAALNTHPSLFSPAWSTGGLPAKMKGPLWEFSVTNPFCHASVPACYPSASLYPSIHPSCSRPLQICLHPPQVGKLIALSSWKEAASGDKHWSASPQQSHLHIKALCTQPHVQNETYANTLQLASRRIWVHNYLSCLLYKNGSHLVRFLN